MVRDHGLTTALGRPDKYLGEILIEEANQRKKLRVDKP
jgi:hypothetical protein